ncbi:MAG: hypothetical protein VYE29_09870 [Pseudomonadota bacterium]|nr:hypothetical protein [Pseudomonadota bacterium]
MIRKALMTLALLLGAGSLQAQSGVDGNWLFTMASPFGEVNADVQLVTDGEKLTGQFDLGNGRVWPIENGVVNGSSISFSVTRDGANMTYLMNADIDGDNAVGAASAMGSTSDWSMTRVK